MDRNNAEYGWVKLDRTTQRLFLFIALALVAGEVIYTNLTWDSEKWNRENEEKKKQQALLAQTEEKHHNQKKW